ncbi:MAG: SH3 domain-containing protein [Candidatus Riflebacteria bacterium]|nr:SH3 domain-containing protein [Candidatus Riflebacteria bacterium]
MKRFAIHWFVAALFMVSALAGTGTAEEGTAAAPPDARGQAVKPEAIRAEPFTDAREVGTLAKGDPVEIQARDGGWLRITSRAGNGWVRMLGIRRGEAGKARFTAEGVLGLASGRAGTGTVVATTGIRGLNEEDLQGARFAGVQVELLESYGVSRAEAREFAGQASLQARSVPYLPGERAR